MLLDSLIVAKASTRNDSDKSMTLSADYYAIYHDKNLGLYSDYTPVHHTVVKEAMPFIKDALGKIWVHLLCIYIYMYFCMYLFINEFITSSFVNFDRLS